MDMRGQNSRRRMTLFIAIFLAVNVIGIFLIGLKESAAIGRRMTGEAEAANDRLEVIMDNYKHSFQFFTQMMAREIEHNPDPDQIWNYLKTIDSKAVEIEGDSFSGLYMYYKDRYLYSWDIPYSKYEKTGYVATERPWYKDALAGNGQIVLTPPYMSYANYYMLSTISQLQPDGETVFAYDIKLGDIQSMISSQQNYVQEQVLAFDQKGTIVGSTNAEYLGGNFYNSLAETK